MRLPLLTLVLLGVLAVSGCAAASPAPTVEVSDPEISSAGGCDGVSVVVDFGPLDAAPVSECVDSTTALDAVSALDSAGVTTEGSVEWGDQIVCRVNERPAVDETVEVPGEASFVESCQSMPPAYAYWAMWVKTSPDAEWEYAQEGLPTLQLEPGQSIGLVYTTGTETPTPAG